MNRPKATRSNATEPRTGSSKELGGDGKDEHHLDIADEEIGHDLGEHDLDWAHRHGEQVLHRAAFALARDRERRNNSVDISKTTQISPGTMLSTVSCSGL
jgi:hypothetical protein